MTDDLKLTDAVVAWQTAGIDQQFTLFKLYTRRLVDTTTGEGGVFEIKGTGAITDFETDPDPVGRIKRVVREWLAHSCRSTGVGVEKWVVEFSPVFERYNIPSHLYLDTVGDRAWLA